MIPVTLPLPDFLHMHSHPLNFALAQLILTMLILLSGRKFYVVGRRAAGGTGHSLNIQGDLLVLCRSFLLLSGPKACAFNPLAEHFNGYLLRIVDNPRPVGGKIHLTALQIEEKDT